MIIGILSDTHGNVDAAHAAVALLLKGGAEYFIHCGDVGEEDVLDALAGPTPSAFVFGNNDWDHAGLARYAEAIGVQCLGLGCVLELGGRRVAVTHGDDPTLTADLAAHAEYLLTGHSHVRHDRRSGTARAINPGALYRATIKTVALLDLALDRLRFVEVPGF